MTQPDNRHHPRILIIDDNPGIHRDFDMAFQNEDQDPHLDEDEKRFLEGHASVDLPKPGYELEHALSGVKGVAMVQENLARGRPFQVAFVDIRMAGIDGVETVERIWQIDDAIQVVLVTAYADYTWEDLARRFGHTDKLLVLKKPFEYVEVIQMACALTEKWSLARQAALKLEQMELLVAQRTQKLLSLQRCEPQTQPTVLAPGVPEEGADDRGADQEPPLILVAAAKGELRRVVVQSQGDSYRFVETVDGRQALKTALELVPDLILGQIDLPGLDGLELCRRVKGDELTSHIPVVCLGAKCDEEEQIKALEAGADDYLVLPASPKLLRARVDNLCMSRRALQESLKQRTVPQPRDVATNQLDARFLSRINAVVEKHLSDYQFDVEVLAQEMAMSRRQLLRKLKAVAGYTPNALIRTLRLDRAAQLLRSSGMTVSEVTYAVGFCDLKHFRTIFREHFGVSPAEYGRNPTSMA